MNKYGIQLEDGTRIDVPADMFEVENDGRLHLIQFDNLGEPVEVAVFNKWLFCALIGET
jgi:hypothetical protein